MKAHIAKTAIGYFAFDDYGKNIAHELFSNNPDESVERISKPIDDSFLSKLGNYELFEDDFADKHARKNLRKNAISLGFCKTDNDFNKYMSSIGISLSRNRLKGIITKDLVMVQASNSLESLNKFINILTEHFKEWFWLNYPEYKGDNEHIISQVMKYGSRESFPDVVESYGMKFEKEDEAVLKEFAMQLNSLIKLKREKESYVRGLARNVAPNISYLVDELLAARMVAAAGSMEKLSRMSAGNIQLLGAEKAMFRHMKNKQSKPPKYGMIFESSWVKNVPDDKRGKAARILASQLYKAAKIDCFTKRDEKSKLKAELEREMAMIK